MRPSAALVRAVAASGTSNLKLSDLLEDDSSSSRICPAELLLRSWRVPAMVEGGVPRNREGTSRDGREGPLTPQSGVQKRADRVGYGGRHIACMSLIHGSSTFRPCSGMMQDQPSSSSIRCRSA